jgi:hypothetical protein
VCKKNKPFEVKGNFVSAETWDTSRGKGPKLSPEGENKFPGLLRLLFGIGEEGKGIFRRKDMDIGKLKERPERIADPRR